MSERFRRFESPSEFEWDDETPPILGMRFKTRRYCAGCGEDNPPPTHFPCEEVSAEQIARVERLADDMVVQMHPHLTCPECAKTRVPDYSKGGGEATDDELILFFVENQGRRSWSDNVKKLREKFTIARRT